MSAREPEGASIGSSRIVEEAPRFLKRLPLAALAAFLAWAVVIAPVQGTVVSWLGERLVRLCESPSQTFFRTEGGRIEVSRPDLPGSSAATISLAPLTMNLALLLALVWATPRASSRGPGAALLAVLALVATDVVHLALTVGAWYATGLGAWSLERFSRLERELLGTSRYLFDVLLKLAIPFALWLATVSVADRDPPGREGAAWREGAAGGRRRRRG